MFSDFRFSFVPTARAKSIFINAAHPRVIIARPTELNLRQNGDTTRPSLA
jgi:hypothetical protein